MTYRPAEPKFFERLSILVVEDNRDLIETLGLTLERGGFIAHKAFCAKDAFRAVAEYSYDLIMIDVMLPDESGFELCRAFRERKGLKDTPIVFLSARSEEIDKVTAFEMGADDYITKPFSVKEMLLRINAIIRRHRPLGEAPTISFGALMLDIKTPKIMVNGSALSLTSLELRLLHLLITRRGRVQTRSSLLSAVWNIEADISTRTVDTHIKRLREKLVSAGSYIRTVRGIGYRFITEDELRDCLI